MSRRHSMSAGVAAVATGLAISLTSAGAAGAGTPAAQEAGAMGNDAAVISEWNSIAMTTFAGDTTKLVPEDLLYMGLVQAAVYDAVVGVRGGYQPYRFHDHARRGTSAQAAAVAAAHRILVTYSPYATATLDTAYASSLAAIPDGTAKTRGIAFGARAAAHLIRLREHDGRGAPILFTKPPAPGVWRPTPPCTAMFDPWLGFVTPLLAHTPKQFAPPAPPALTSARYARDFAEVKADGAKTSTTRTAEQTATAVFYSGSSIVQFNVAMQDQVRIRKLGIVDAARMFAAVDMSVADGVITVWRAKYDLALWRPLTAINLADTDGNPATTADPTWEPLAPTPCYPEYPSGYNVASAGTTTGIEKLFSTHNLRLTLTSTAVPGETRFYHSGAVLRDDVVDARIWLGIHFRFGDTAARDLTRRLTGWALDHYFQRVTTSR